MKRALAAIVGAAAAASVALNVYPVFFEEPPELWHELHDVREALVDAGDRICLPTGDVRGAERFAQSRYLAEWGARAGLIGMGLLSGVLVMVTLRERRTS